MIDVPRTLDSDAILAALMNSYSELTNDGDTNEQYGVFQSIRDILVSKTLFYTLLQIMLLDDSKMINRLTGLFRRSSGNSNSNLSNPTIRRGGFEV